LVLRYLNAFDPASVADVQAWCGMTKIVEVVDRLRPQLRTYTDLESGRELFDVLGMELPDPDVPAPARFLPEYDSLLLSHADRNRMIDDAQRSRLLVRGNLTCGAVLYDGRVCATWKVQQQGRRLLTFVADPAASTEVRVLA
jgi:hypothetical protein